jgi:hypothetical protein
MFKITYSSDRARPVYDWTVEEHATRREAEAAAIELLMAGFYVSWDESEATE